MSDAPTDLVACRARWFVASNLAMALALLVLAVLNIGHQLQTGGAVWVGVLIAAMLALYAWQVARQLGDRRPIVAVRADGLFLPTASQEPIAWVHIRGVTLGGLVTSSQLDIALDEALIARLTLGQRFLGDSVVKRRGFVPGITILARNLDRRAEAILAAVRRHWPAHDAGPGDPAG